MQGASRILAIAALCMGISGIVAAQIFSQDDWVESVPPPPPAFSTTKLIPITMPRYMTLDFGVDPATIVITGDGVVRYVVVARNPSGGAVNAFYEGVRCATAEVKGYARSTGGEWEMASDPQWKPLRFVNSSYSKALATQALCGGAAPRSSVREMVQRLERPVREIE
jgi:hypothetical protein